MSNREGGVEVLLVNLVLVVRRLRESPVSCTYFDVGTAGADVFFSFFLSFLILSAFISHVHRHFISVYSCYCCYYYCYVFHQSF